MLIYYQEGLKRWPFNLCSTTPGVLGLLPSILGIPLDGRVVIADVYGYLYVRDARGAATGSAHERAHRGPHHPPRSGDRRVQQRPAHWLRCGDREYQAGVRDQPPRVLGRGVPE